MEIFIIIGLFILLLHYYNKYKMHKDMHEYYKEESKNNFKDFIKVVKHNNELKDKLNNGNYK